MSSTHPQTLIIDDDAMFRERVAKRFRASGIDVTEAATLEEAKRCLDRRYTFVLIDHELHGKTVGLQLCKLCLQKGIRDFAIVTGHEDDQTAKEFLSLGINSFYPKTKFVPHLDELIRQIRSLAASSDFESLFQQQFVTESTALKAEIRSVATSFSSKSIFISGETGVGKTAAARLIHLLSGVTGKFVHLNCAQTEDALIESELFGHEKGAFTGASSSRKGKLEHAENGTLFLDEIGNLSARAQEKLLVAIEERKFCPIGSNVERSANFRLISATKEDLLQRVKTNHFREDLFYRITGINLNIPPLRQRQADIPLLVQHFLNKLPKRIIISDEALARMMKYRWPGNIRELSNLIESFDTKACGLITPEMLPVEIQKGFLRTTSGTVLTPDQIALIQSIGLPAFVQTIEQEAVQRSLSQNNWKQSATQTELQISKPVFYRIYRGMTDGSTNTEKRNPQNERIDRENGSHL